MRTISFRFLLFEGVHYVLFIESDREKGDKLPVQSENAGGWGA